MAEILPSDSKASHCGRGQPCVTRTVQHARRSSKFRRSRCLDAAVEYFARASSLSMRRRRQTIHTSGLNQNSAQDFGRELRPPVAAPHVRKLVTDDDAEALFGPARRGRGKHHARAEVAQVTSSRVQSFRRSAIGLRTPRAAATSLTRAASASSLRHRRARGTRRAGGSQPTQPRSLSAGRRRRR